MLCGVWWLTSQFGIQGTAIAWMLRVAVDMGAMYVVTWWLLPDTAFVIRRSALMVIIALGVFMLAAFTMEFSLKMLILAGVVTIFFPAAWFLVLTDRKKAFISNRIRLFSFSR